MAKGYTPVYRILREGQDITASFSDRCISLRIDFSDTDGGNNVATFVLDDRDWKIASPPIGEALQIYLGYLEVGMSYMGQFVTNTITYSGVPKTMTLKCMSADNTTAMKSPIVKSFEKQTLGQIIGELAKIGGTSALVHPDIAGKTVEFKNMLVSPNQLLQEIERQYGVSVSRADGRIIATPADGGQTVAGATMPVVSLTQEHFGNWNVREDERTAYSKVHATYLDPKTNKVKAVTENSPNRGDVNASDFPIGRRFNNEAEAKAAAKAQMQALVRGRVEGEFQLAKGDPWVRNMQRIRVYGMREGVNGSYVADIVSHTYTKEDGIKTGIRARGDSTGADYETLFAEATAEERKTMFLDPLPGDVVGTMIGSMAANALPGLIPGSLPR